jgi:fatty acid omega-hydroxylase
LIEIYGRDRSMITSDPPDHDQMRRFGPPHSPDIIPDMGKTCVQIVNNYWIRPRARSASTLSMTTPIRSPWM